MEPFYETEGPSKNEVIGYINNMWICKQLNLSENTFEETQKLMHKYNTTFDAIRINNTEWKTMLTQIIEEEVVKGKGTYDSFGSYRGYYTFVHGQITKNVEERIIREMWSYYYLGKKIKVLQRAWVHNKFAPDGNGYFEAMCEFNELKNR